MAALALTHFMSLAMTCAPSVHPETMAALVRVESGFNPYAIGVVGGRLVRQPKNLPEALATVRALETAGWNFSVGLAQVNRHNLDRLGMDWGTAFDPCGNLRAGSEILAECYGRARPRSDGDQRALHAALSCYYSGNFQRGFAVDAGQGSSYVQRVLASAARMGVAMDFTTRGKGRPAQLPASRLRSHR
jgi:type IV secretion system protein VirB1